ncbi:MAG: type II toxin-antitoxin system Phd/YefM family antitoxin [Acidobacteriota bacterium]
MAITTVSSREFNQDTSRAKKAAEKGPVIITDRGRPAHVLLSIAQYRKLTGRKKTLAEMLAMDNPDDIDPNFEFPRIGTELSRPADLR